MAKKRKVYTITHAGFRINDKNLQGTRLILVGDSTWDGQRSAKNNQFYKSDLTHKLFKFEDQKMTKDLGLPKTYVLTFSKAQLSTYLTETKEDEING